MSRKKVIYVAGPFRGPSHWAIEENIRAAERLALEVWNIPGCVALCPHANTAHFQGAAPDEVWLDGDIELLRRCDAVVVTSDWQKSSGAMAEVHFARNNNIPVFFSIDSLKDWVSKIATKVIGIGYKKRSGKDTFAGMLQDAIDSRGLECFRTGFAYALKNEVCEAIGITVEQLEADKVKYRPILQWWGTEFRRSQNENYWIDKVRDQIQKSGAGYVIVTDVRFRNEADFIKSLDGTLIRMDRPGLETTDTHSSETEMDSYNRWDYIIKNDAGIGELRSVADLLVDKLK